MRVSEVGEGACSARYQEGRKLMLSIGINGSQHEYNAFTDIIPIHNRRVVIFLGCCFCHFCCVQEKKNPHHHPHRPRTWLRKEISFCRFFFFSLFRRRSSFFVGNLHNFEVFLFVLVCAWDAYASHSQWYHALNWRLHRLSISIVGYLVTIPKECGKILTVWVFYLSLRRALRIGRLFSYIFMGWMVGHVCAVCVCVYSWVLRRGSKKCERILLLRSHFV